MSSDSQGMGSWNGFMALLRTWKEALGFSRPARLFLLVSGLVLASAILVGLLLQPQWALIPGLIGFGLCLVSLFRAAIPSLSGWLERLGRPAALAAWAALTLAFAVAGFSSTVVIVVVLFIGGFVAANVAWRLLTRALDLKDRPSPAIDGTPEDVPHPNLLLLGILTILFLSVTASFLIGYYNLHERGSLGMALLFANVGLVIGAVPTAYRVIQRLRASTPSQEHPVGSRYLLRDTVFTVAVAGLIGYEVSLATEGRTFFAIPILAIIIVIASYAVVLIRGFISLEERLRPYKPLLISALGMLLVFSPLIVFLSNQPATLTRLYGGAQAAGLLSAMVYIGMTNPWREEARLLWTRLRSAARRKVEPWLPEFDIKEERASEEGQPAKRGRWSLRRSGRARRARNGEEGGG